MNKSSLDATPSNRRVFTALLLNFAILVTPIAAVAARTETSQRKGQRSEKAQTGGTGTEQKAASRDTFANPAPPVPAASPVIAASMTDSIENDDGDGKIDPTDGTGSTERIIYSTTIQNNGTVDATGVQFTDTIDSHTTLVGGSLNVSPLAGDDSYDTISNTLLEVGPVSSPNNAAAKVTVNGNVISNDTEFLGDTFALTKLQAVNFSGGTATATTNQGGSVTMDSLGQFSYVPAANFLGDDTFTYTISDDGTDAIAGNADDLTSVGTVTIHVKDADSGVAASQVWYVKNNVAGPGTGTSTDPFKLLSAAQAAANGTGDTVYVYTGDGTTASQNAGFTFQANTQKLTGEGVALSVNQTVNGNAAPNTLRVAGSAAHIGNAAGDAVTVTNKSGIVIRGFVISDSANGIAATYSAAGGGVTISNNSIAGGTGNAIDITSTPTTVGGGSATITNNAITAAGVEGIDINAGGTGTLNLTVDTNTITSTGNGFDVAETAGACNVSFTNNTGITSGATGVNIGKTGGTLSVTAFSGNQVTGTTAGNGVVFSGVIFDSNPATGAADALTAGTVNIGTSGAGNGVGLSGIVMVNTTGTLPFTTLNVFADSGRGIDALGSGSGTAGLTASGSIDVEATGGSAVKLDGLNINLTSGLFKSTNSPDNGVAIGLGSGVTGTFSAVNTSSITNAAGDDFAVGAGTADITWNASLNNSSGGNAVDVTGHTGGTVSFTGSITDSVQGINLVNNTGATINFTGALTISTGTNAAFTATGGGTVSSTASTSTLTTTTGRALNVQNTTIGASNLIFQSISANGGANGIVLLNTGASGHLAVNGTGSAGTGGTIQAMTGADAATNACADLGSSIPAGVGIYMKSTNSPSFSWMNFPGTFSNFGILGYSVTNFTLDHSTLSGTYGDNVNQDEDTVHFCTLTGSATISNSTISNGAESNLRIVNASGTLNRLTMSNDTFGLNQTNGGGGVLLEADNSGTVFNATVTDSTFQGSRGTPFQVAPQANTTMDLVFGTPGHGNTIHNTHSNIVSFTQDLLVTPGGTLTFDVNSNHFDSASAVQAQGGVLINAANSTANATGYFRNNTIGTSGVANSGSSGNDPALDIESNGGGDLVIVVDNNTIRQFGSNGAGVLVQPGATAGNAVTFQVTFTNNSIAEPGTFAVANNAQGFQLNSGTNSGENFTSCLKFQGNVFDTSGTGAGGDGRFRQRFDTKVQMPGYTGAADGTTGSPTVVSYIQGLNPTGPPTITSISSTAGGGGFFNTSGGNPCTVPGFLQSAPGGVEASRTSLFDLLGGHQFFGNGMTTSALTNAQMITTSLDQQQLDTIVAAAITRWANSGLTAEQLAILRDMKFEVADLSGSYLGEADGSRTLIDRDAGGRGWFVDDQPLTNSYFSRAAAATRLYTAATDAPAGHVDLLTAIEHEMGHKLGLIDSYDLKDRDSLMYGYLTVGERRTAAPGQAKTALTVGADKHYLLLVDENDIVAVTADGKVLAANNAPAPSVMSRATDWIASGVSAIVSNVEPTAYAEAANKVKTSTRNTVSVTNAAVPFSGETVTFDNGGSGFTLPVGKSVTIVFKVTLNNLPGLSSLNPPRVSNQGRVFGTNFTLVNGVSSASPNTDDPAPPVLSNGTHDATETLADLFNTTTAVQTSGSPSFQGDSVTFTATVSFNPTGSPTGTPGTPTGTVQFLDGATPITCDQGSTSTQTLNGSGVATCTTSALSAAAHTINVNYNGDGNFDTSSGNVSQTVNPCTNNPIVTTTADSGAGSLRDAITSACSGTTIDFNIAGAGPHTITLTTGELSLNRNVTIQNTSGKTIIVSGGGTSRVFNLAASKTASISNITMTNGNASGNGGAILASQGSTLTLTNVTVSNSTAAGGGGGVGNQCSSPSTTTIIIKNSTISGNTANDVVGGGGVYQDCGSAGSAIYIDNSTINGNQATTNAGGGYGGGGISTQPGGKIVVSNSTISNNTATKSGGGIYAASSGAGEVVLTNVTLSGNQTNGDGGGLNGRATLFNTTITNNRADADNDASGSGGGIFIGSSSVSLLNTIVSGNFSGNGSTASDIAGAGTATGSFNLIGTGGSGGLVDNISGNHVGVADAGLGALANNGGATQTHKLLSTSIAIEAGTDVTTLSGNGGSITAVATSVIVADATAIPQNVSFVIQVDSEQMSVTSKSANTLTVVRGVNGTTAATHNDGAAVNPAFDQRGSGFPRKADSADANTTQTVDIGAYEAHPTVEDITDKSTAEDTPFNFNFNIGDGTTTPTLITSVTATSNNAALVPNANLSVTGSGATRNLAITPVANANTPQNGTATITVTVTATNGQTATDTFVLTVTAVADTPSVTNASTTVNVQTVTGLVISRNAADSTETAFFKISGISNGTLFKNDGTTQINNGDFITFAEGNAGLKFTPANNSTASGSFNVQGSNDNVGTGLSAGSATATITVTKNASNTAVTSSANPSFQNQSVTFTATVTSATTYTGTPSGNVDFFDNLVAIAGCSARPLNGSGVATCTTSALSVGNHPISATYNGDAAFLSSTGNLNTNPQVVNASLALVVNTTDDTVDANIGNGICADVNGNCSLRAAIQETNFAASDDNITFANGAGQAFDPATAPHTITLTSSLPDVTSSLTITGPGPKATAVTISGNNLYRILGVTTASVNLNLNLLAFTAGKVGGGQNAAAIEFNTAGTLTIDECEIFGNVDPNNIALYANGSTGIVISRSTFRGNVDAMKVEAVPTFTVNNSTIANNSARGIYNLSTSLVVTNSTIADNSGGIFNDSTTHAVAASLGNTILSNNANNNLVKVGLNTNTFTSNGHNLIDDNSGAANLAAPGPGDLLGTSVVAGIAALADNGGPTQTRALLSGSAAFDAGDNTLATNAGLTTDQRGAGFNRSVDGPDADTTATVDIGAFEAQGSIEDITDKSTNEDTQLQFTFNVSNGVSSGNVTCSSSNTTIVPNANCVVTGASSPLTLTINPAANQNTVTSGPITITVTVTSGGDSMSDTFLLTVLSIPDQPSVSAATTNEDVQTTSGLVVTKNGADGADVAFFKITNILNGSLFKNDGTTPIANGGVITEAEGNAGLKFTPAANFFGTAHFDVQASTANDGSNAGTATTANITVNAVADTPSITATTTNEDTQSTTGLVISRNPADGAEVTNFKITGITGGTLFQNNGTTQINNGDFITFAQGNAGLKFTPAADAYTPANTFGFTIQASTTADNSGLGGSTVDASITVNPIADTPSVTNSSTQEDTQTTTGLVISRNAVDGNEVAFFKIANITNGTLFKNDGTTPIVNNQFITFAEGNAGLKFTPSANFFGNGSFQVYGSIDNSGTGLSANFATATITVSAVGDPPSITPTTTNEDTQSSSGLVITKNAADGAEVTFFKITGITNGTLFQNNGTTQINNGDFISVAQGGAGLKFTPSANLYSPVSNFTFNAAAATDNVGGGLGSSTAASITVNAVADSPSVTPNPQTTAISTQSGPMVINRNAADGAEVTHFKITNITNGALFQNDGTTAINNNDFITFAQGNAGLKFTPVAGLSSPANQFGFDVQASLNNTNGGLGPDPAVHENIIVSCSDPQLVTKILDDGSSGTLRYAIANSCPGTGTITFDTAGVFSTPQTITLGSPLTITKTLSIIGPTSAGTGVAVNGSGNRVLDVTGGSPTISSLTFTGALVSGGNGGGLRNTGSGTITLNAVTFSGNSADNGGAIATTAGTIVLNNSTISGNTATTDGGGIYVNGGTVTLLNDTITNNTATAGQGGGLNRVSGTVNVKNTIIAGNTATANANVAGTINDQGNNILSGNPQLAPLANNGGPTMTHALLSNGPALDAGDNTAAAALVTDQRGNTFGRFRDAANDADTTQTVDIGSFEADPSVEDIQDKTTNEDTPLPTFSFRVADSFSAFDSITATSNNQTLVPNANIVINGSGNSRTMDIAPALNQFGQATITVTVTKTINSTQVSMSDTFVLTVNPVGDTPNATNATTNEDTQSTSGLVITRNLNDGAEIANFKITNITGGVLFKNDGTTVINNNDFITVAEGNAGLKFTPAANLNSAAGDTFGFQVQSSRDAIGTGLSAGAATATITVNAVNDVPSFTKGPDKTVLANSGAQTVIGWATALLAGPGNESGQTLDFIVNNNNNTLFSTQPAVSPTGVLTYTPATNQNGTAVVSVQIHDNGGTALGGVDTSAVQTFNITVNRSSTTTSLASDHNPSFTNQVVTFTATVTSNTAVVGPPTGTVQFFEGVNPLNCSNGNTSTEPVDGTGKAICQISTLTTAGSPHSINSTYSGDGAFIGSSSNTVSQNVTPPLTLTVNSSADTADPVMDGVCDVDLATPGNQCTLRAAIQEANFAASDDTINFSLPANSTINLLTALPAIDGNVVINGPGANTLTVQRSTAGGTPQFRIFTINSGKIVTINGLTISNGSTPAGPPAISSGAGIFNNGGTLTLTNSTVSGNASGTVGGVFNEAFGAGTTATTTITNCTISGNSAHNVGSGVENDAVGAGATATLTISNSTISGNSTPNGAPAIFNSPGSGGTATVTVTNSTISGNTGGGVGSSTSNGAGTNAAVTITNSTISGNSGGSDGGIGNFAVPGTTSVLTLTNCTVSGNSGVSNSGGLTNSGPAVAKLSNTIVAGNFIGSTPSDIAGTVDPSSSFNLIGSGGAGGLTNGVNNNIVGVANARLAPLANNGGTTQTMALLSGSPALDAGSNTLATNAGLTTDQRGGAFNRFVDGPDADAIAQVDIGAFEAQPSIEDIADKSTNEDTALPSFNFTIAGFAALSNLTVTASSSNTTLVPNGNLNVGGAGATRSLSITPAPNQNGTSTITVTVAGTLGATPVSMADTFVLTVNAVNDAPTFNLNAGPTVNEDSGPQSIPNQAVNISAGPADESGQTLAFTVTNNNNGLFSVQPAISPTGTLTFTSAPDANGTATVSVTLKDNGGTANGGQDTSATQQFTITVNAVNDAPVNTVPGAQQVTENSPLTFSTANANAISIADVDAGGGAMRETLTATNGTLTLGSTAGLAFSVGNGTANPTMTFTGTIAAVNNALQGMTFNPTNGFSGAATLTIVTNDQGNTGSGGALSDTDVVNITVNDGGTLQLSAATYTVGENSGPAVITITRTGGTAGTATVKFDTSNGTATAGSDYTAVSQTVTFNNGETSKTVNIPITDDLLNEPDETVNITLSNAGGSGALGTPATAVLTITNDDPAGGYIKFSAANYNVNEGGVATITVQRVGTLSQAVTIDFATTDNSDPAALVPCAPTPGNTLATSRCDFESAFGRISFAAGDGADKTFTVMTQQDNYVEGPETLTLTLSNATGGAGILGLPSATLTILDDLSEPPGNAVDDTNNFVESLYRDFLNRPSDPAGKAFWVQNIDKCNDPAQRPPNMTQAQCIAAFRVSTAQAFFLSDEFQRTGGTAYLTNKVAFGSLPIFIRFEKDAQMIGKGYVFGAPGADALLEANKVAYFNDYVSRTEFVNTYGPLSNQQYVETLTQNTGVVWGLGEKQALVDGLNNATETRATVLRKITEKPSFVLAERESMFVLTEYFGFLRRNPDQGGFNFWLNKLHAANGNAMQAEMVRAFIESAEYRQRFGQ